MNLYEVTNGYMGYSYVRVYVWAANEVEAKKLAKESYKKEEEEVSDSPVLQRDGSFASDRRDTTKNLVIELLLSSSDAAFATEPSDSGFEKPTREE